MLSRLATLSTMPRAFAKVLHENGHGMQNLILKRDSHNVIMIKTTPYHMRFNRNWLHFYFILVGAPLAFIVTYINARANPVLIEEVEGYRPRHWEYERNPISRFLSRYGMAPAELDHEVVLSQLDNLSERVLCSVMKSKVEKIMKFYGDHRSRYFLPNLGADLLRSGYQELGFNTPLLRAAPGHFLDRAYDPDRPQVPVEGFPDGPVPGMK